MTRTIYKVVGDEPEGPASGSTAPDPGPHPAEPTVDDAGDRGNSVAPLTGGSRRRGVMWVLAGIAILVIIMIVVIAVLEIAESPAAGTDPVRVAGWAAGLGLGRG